MSAALPPHPLARRLRTLHADLLQVSEGRIPAAEAVHAGARDLRSAFGVAIATATGHLHRAGDTDVEVPLQSAAKPFVYALALADAGRDVVLDRIGVEPTGVAFDALLLEHETGRPPNPMVNAGAILATCLVSGDDAAGRVARIVEGVSAFAGRPLAVHEDVVREELAVADRNRALAHLMVADGTLPVPAAEAIEVYLRSCAITVTTADLAVMGATLATGGRNPLTGEQVVPPEVVTTVLAVMSTCGMYDGAGSWFVRVGLPAKSGVSGTIVAVKPGELAVATVSAPLDRHGNSVRGVLACERLSDELGLHEFTPGGAGLEVVCSCLDGRQVQSSVVRPEPDAAALAAHPDRLRLVELAGPLTVAAADELVRLLRDTPDAPAPRWTVADLRAVGHVHPPARALLDEAVTQLRDAGCPTVLVEAAPGPQVPRLHALAESDDVDRALAWCEDALLRHLRTADGGRG
ncbi:hypothetical protein GCM10027047_09320 [Rhodococcus aerolatus]